MATMINLNELIQKANGANAEAKKALRREYKKAASKIHPDHGGSEEQMAKLNEEYKQKEALLGIDAELREAIEKIITLPNINIELCGTWVWVSGDTKASKDAIKAAGYRWAHKKMMWYYRKADDVSTGRGKGKSMAYIRNKYGSEELKKDGINGYLK
ncbi:MAG: molecular chaperone DnaJ [Schwartzia sp.]|nr:molecular chaperone DnaJ [Schwartzia sp. (in: firmicutes)]